MKYIDAEKLIAEIEKRQEYLGDHNFHSMASEYDWLLTMVQSLQQEQPEGLHFTPLNRLIQKIPSKNWNDTVNNYAKKLRDCLIKEGYRKDAEVLQGYISYMNGNNVPMATMDEQEQPEVDLEKEIDIKEELGVIKLWFDTIRNYAVTKRNANGILLSDTRMLEIIALSAKDASEYIELLLGGLI